MRDGGMLVHPYLFKPVCEPIYCALPKYTFGEGFARQDSKAVESLTLARTLLVGFSLEFFVSPLTPNQSSKYNGERRFELVSPYETTVST